MSTDRRILVIDLLRGLSCLGILLYHVRIDLWIGWWRITGNPQDYSSFAKAMAWLSIPTPFLGYAILLFFLISGFCIHYPNVSLNSRPCWKTYCKRRFWRIYPTYLIAILLTSLISYYCHTKWSDNTWSLERIFRVVTLSQNYPPRNGQFLSNPSLWTIPLEVEFYALYPIAFFFLNKFGFIRLLFFSLLISGITTLLTKPENSWISFTSLFLWPSWLLGAYMGHLYKKNKFTNLKNSMIYPLLVVFLTFGLVSRLHNWDSWLQYSCWIGFYLFFFIACLRSEERFKSKQGLILKSIAWLGKISFSLYLIHFPLFKILGLIHRESFGEKPANFIVTLLYLIPVILLAWLFFKYIENPIHNWSKKENVKA